VHIFCHRGLAYPFQTDGANDWMGRHFFTGGIMPSADLFSQFRDDLTIRGQWSVNGTHYARTCEDWLVNLDQNRGELLRALACCGAKEPPQILLQRWRIFMMACAELFAYNGGTEWFVSHYLFQPVASRPTPTTAPALTLAGGGGNDGLALD
jgi:cyclopropane-fatty-acyl-phospholipid synthase